MDVGLRFLGKESIAENGEREEGPDRGNAGKFVHFPFLDLCDSELPINKDLSNFLGGLLSPLPIVCSRTASALALPRSDRTNMKEEEILRHVSVVQEPHKKEGNGVDVASRSSCRSSGCFSYGQNEGEGSEAILNEHVELDYDVRRLQMLCFSYPHTNSVAP